MFSLTQEVHEDSTKCSILGTGKQVTIRKGFPLGVIMVGHDMVVDQHDDSVLLVGPRSLFVELPCSPPSRHTLVELCAGVGGIGIGASLGGFRPICQVDKNHLATRHLEQLRMCDVLCMDITSDECFRQIHELGHVNVTTIAAGFNCQPFSYLGGQRGMKDPRALSLLGTLRGAYLLRPSSLVLECTPGAGLDFQVREILRAFLALMTWTSQDITFDLSAQWPCRRLRWWIICYPQSCQEIPFVAWPINPKFAAVGNIIREWPIWSPEEMDLLRLTVEEQDAYFVSHPTSQRILDMSGPAPTFLHSYGNATMMCPCGRRSTGFCSVRLEKDGPRGFMIHDPAGAPRFLHPREVAFLLSFPAGFPVMSQLLPFVCLDSQRHRCKVFGCFFISKLFWQAKLIVRFLKLLRTFRHNCFLLSSICGQSQAPEVNTWSRSRPQMTLPSFFVLWVPVLWLICLLRNRSICRGVNRPSYLMEVSGFPHRPCFVRRAITALTCLFGPWNTSIVTLGQAFSLSPLKAVISASLRCSSFLGVHLSLRRCNPSRWNSHQPSQMKMDNWCDLMLGFGTAKPLWCMIRWALDFQPLTWVCTWTSCVRLPPSFTHLCPILRTFCS